LCGVELTGGCVVVAGWTPAAFVSSRQQKASQQQARPEDFMDEEVGRLHVHMNTKLYYS